MRYRKSKERFEYLHRPAVWNKKAKINPELSRHENIFIHQLLLELARYVSRKKRFNKYGTMYLNIELTRRDVETLQAYYNKHAR